MGSPSCGVRERGEKVRIWRRGWRPWPHLYGDRVIEFDTPAARIAGAMADRARGRGQAPGFADIVIAATAQRHKLTILSRNVRHFDPLGAIVLDPFVALPPT